MNGAAAAAEGTLARLVPLDAEAGTGLRRPQARRERGFDRFKPRLHRGRPRRHACRA